MENKPIEIRTTALISDDDDFFRMALTTVLKERLGFSEVLQTANLDAAIEQLASSDAVQLALFDLNMPGMNNWQNLRTVRESFPALRVAVVSGSQDRNDILMALSIGMHGYINKGLGISELTRALQSICAGTVYLPPFLPNIPITPHHPVSLPNSDWGHQTGDGNLKDFTPRQREVLELLVGGKSNKAMARALNLSEGTVKFHLSAVFRNLGSANRVEAAASAARLLDRKQL